MATLTTGRHDVVPPGMPLGSRRVGEDVRLSLLDRSRTRADAPDAAALEATVARAVHAERVGFDRFWVAEHHAVPGIASGSMSVTSIASSRSTPRSRLLHSYSVSDAPGDVKGSGATRSSSPPTTRASSGPARSRVYGVMATSSLSSPRHFPTTSLRSNSSPSSCRKDGSGVAFGPSGSDRCRRLPR